MQQNGKIESRGRKHIKAVRTSSISTSSRGRRVVGKNLHSTWSQPAAMCFSDNKRGEKAETATHLWCEQLELLLVVCLRMRVCAPAIFRYISQKGGKKAAILLTRSTHGHGSGFLLAGGGGSWSRGRKGGSLRSFIESEGQWRGSMSLRHCRGLDLDKKHLKAPFASLLTDRCPTVVFSARWTWVSLFPVMFDGICQRGIFFFFSLWLQAICWFNLNCNFPPSCLMPSQ